MELLLNLVWLLVAAGAVVLWIFQRRRGASRDGGCVFLQAVALACALAVLFPAISATDDLHAAQLAVEASDVARKVMRSINSAGASGTSDWLHYLPAVLLLALAAVSRRRKLLGTVFEPRLLPLHTALFSSVEGRAPPVRFQA